MAAEERRYWDDRYRALGRLATAPALFVQNAIDRYASAAPGRAVDVAGGTGRHAIWLARRGWDVTLIDVAAVAIELAQHDADAAGVRLAMRCEDLDEVPFPRGPWDLAVVHHYLNRALMPRIADALAPGGLLVFAQPTVENLRRNDRPGPRYSLGAGEAARLVSGLEVLSIFEGWTDDGRHEGQVVARRRA